MKVFKAQCAANVVTVDGLPVSAEVQSNGVGSSEGLLLIEKDGVYYVCSSSEDLKDLIQALNGCLTDILSALTALNGATVPPAVATGSIATLTTKAAQLAALEAVLR